MSQYANLCERLEATRYLSDYPHLLEHEAAAAIRQLERELAYASKSYDTAFETLTEVREERDCNSPTRFRAASRLSLIHI